jgi:hypothetical protein
MWSCRHRTFDRFTASFVAPVDDRSNGDGIVGIQPEFDIRIPAGVIANMVYREKVKYFVDWPVNHLG